MIMLRTFLRRAAVALLALMAVACSAAQSKTLTGGMTPDQAVQTMGEPDLKDNIADPNHSGMTVQRYIWLDQGKAAIFGTDNRLASVQAVEVGSNTKQQVEQQAHAEAQASSPAQPFDPIETPLNYLFFPAKAATIYFGAGLSCATGAACEKPQLPAPSDG